MIITVALTCLFAYGFILGTAHEACSRIADCTSPEVRLAMMTLRLTALCKAGDAYMKCVDGVINTCRNEDMKKQIMARASSIKSKLEKCPKTNDETSANGEKLKNVWCAIEPSLAPAGVC